MFSVKHDELCYDGPRPTTLEEAWEITLAKWEFLAETPVQDCGPETCGLCMLYFYDFCKGCPIEEAGFPSCSETPYVTYDYARWSGTADPKPIAQRELEFLKGIKEKTVQGRLDNGSL